MLLVDSPELVRRQAVPWGAKATRAVLVLVALVAMLASGQVPPAIAGLVAAVAMVLLRVVTVTQAYRAVSWQTVVLVGALIPLSTAISTSGAADQVASLLIDAVGTGRPYLLLVAHLPAHRRPRAGGQQHRDGAGRRADRGRRRRGHRHLGEAAS